MSTLSSVASAATTGPRGLTRNFDRENIQLLAQGLSEESVQRTNRLDSATLTQMAGDVATLRKELAPRLSRCLQRRSEAGTSRAAGGKKQESGGSAACDLSEDQLRSAIM